MTKVPVYIVSGYMRSGTSMMMKVLEKGGMHACYNTQKDKILSEKFAKNDYHPNPGGFYELGPKEFDDPGFPEIYRGKLIKALHWRLKQLPPFTYRVVFMLRDPKEIEVSYLSMFRQRPPFVLHTYEKFIEKTLAGLTARGDMDVSTVWYGDMMDNPGPVIDHLIAIGFPVTDREKAVNAVNRSLYRSKADDLETVRNSIPNLRTDIPDFLKH